MQTFFFLHVKINSFQIFFVAKKMEIDIQNDLFFAKLIIT